MASNSSQHHHRQQQYPYHQPTHPFAATGPAPPPPPASASSAAPATVALDPQSQASVNHVAYRAQVSIEALSYKLQQATDLLERATSYEETHEVATVITALGGAIESLRHLLYPPQPVQPRY